LSAHDACYLALAELLGCGLLTADARLSRAPGIRCAVTVVPG
jgi:predicted nucleic acid-binding protein